MSPKASSRPAATAAQRRNRNVAIICVLVFAGMVGAAYAAIPVYRAFCQVTGYGGTIRKAQAAPKLVSQHTVTVSFDANVRDLPLQFAPEQGAQTLRLGETKLAFFKATNTSDKPLIVRALYNVAPDQAGTYFRKLQCFCFSDQTIAAHQTVELPVLYFVDPKLADDSNTRNTTDITLSYTFFRAVDAKPQG